MICSEEKNQLIYNYIYNLSNSINKKNGVIIDNSIFNSVVNQYTNSLDDVEKIKKEIDNFFDELIKKEEKIDTPTDLIEKIRQLNPSVQINVSNLEYENELKIDSSIPIEKLNLPEGFYYNEKTGITNKNKTENGNYVSLNLNSIDSVPKVALISKSANLKTIENKEKVIPTIPSMTQNRKQEIVSKKIQKMKMTSTEKKLYPLLTQKRQKKIEQRKNKQSKINSMTYKKQTQLNSNKSTNGFINIIYASIILIVVVIIYLILIK